MRIERMYRDVRFALRSMRKEPGFTALVILTLALGIGSATAIFSVVNGVMLRSLPYPDSERLVQVAETVGREAANTVPTSLAYYRDWQEGTRAFDGLAAYQPFTTVVLTGDGDVPIRLTATYVTSSYFELLGATPARGRLFGPEEDRAAPLEAPVVVIGPGLWQRRFGSDPDIVGRTVALDGRTHRIVGVMAPDFDDVGGGATSTDVWLPAAMAFPQPERAHLRTLRIFSVVGRLEPGVELEEARDEIESFAARMAEEYPDVHGNTGATVLPLREQVIGAFSGPLLALLGGAGVLLLVACVNVAGLVLVRGSRRTREMALRRAMGASRARLIAQLVTESVVLAVVGGVAGVLLASVSVEALVGMSGIVLPGYVEVGVDRTVLAVSVLVAFATGIGFGLWPALRSSRMELRAELGEGGARAGGDGGSILRSGLVVAEVAMAVVLLVGSGLLVRSFHELRSTETGLRTEGVLTVRMSLAREEYPDPASIYALNDRVQERLGALPGVSFAAVWGPNVPGAANVFTTVVPEGRTVESQLDADLTRMHHVSPGALEAIGLEVVTGRAPSASDGSGDPPVVAVSESLARALWPGEEAVGKRLRHFVPQGRDPEDFPWYRVVGVVSDALHSGIGVATTSFPTTHDLYFAYRQREADLHSPVIVVGADDDPAQLVRPVTEVLSALAPRSPVFDVQTLSDRISGQLVVPRFTAILMSAFGLLSLLLAALGVYGLLASYATAHSREIGLRKALGASGSATAALFVGRGLKLVLLGAALGVASSVVLSRFVEGLLVGVTPRDPLTLVTTVGILVAVAFVAAWVPTRRALRVEPVVALRAD